MMRYEDWESEVPGVIREDSLWKMEAYRLATFAGDLGWHDVTKLMKDRRTLALAGQLYRALGSVSANLAEGYSRGSGKDRARFYEYALGSARESREWYYKGRHILGEKVTQHRLHLLTQIIRLLLATIPQQRQHTLREETTTYQTPSNHTPSLKDLLQNIPLPDS
jgi:four helix bundle protein